MPSRAGEQPRVLDRRAQQAADSFEQTQLFEREVTDLEAAHGHHPQAVTLGVERHEHERAEAEAPGCLTRLGHRRELTHDDGRFLLQHPADERLAVGEAGDRLRVFGRDTAVVDGRPQLARLFVAQIDAAHLEAERRESRVEAGCQGRVEVARVGDRRGDRGQRLEAPGIEDERRGLGTGCFHGQRWPDGSTGH